MIKVVRQYRYTAQDRDRQGNVRVYLRYPGGRKIRLRAEPGTPEFDREYRIALALAKAGGIPEPAARRERVVPGTMAELYEIYRGSGRFGGLSARTQYVQRRKIERFLAEKGRGAAPYVIRARAHCGHPR